MLSFEKSPLDNHSSLMWSRTVVGKHCFLVDKLTGVPASETAAQRWLDSLVKENQQNTMTQLSSPTQNNNTVIETTDPFVDELLNRNINRPVSPTSTSSVLSSASTQDIGDMLQVVRQSRRQPAGLDPVSHKIDEIQLNCLDF